MITRSQISPAIESSRGVSGRFKWRAKHTAIFCLLAVLLLLFLVLRVLIAGTPDRDGVGRNTDAIEQLPGSWLRDTRIEDTERHYLVRMSIPGIEEDELEVVLDSGVLKVTGKRSVSKLDEGSGWMRRSEMRSCIQKTCAFPGGVGSQIEEIRIEDGVLLVVVPKAGN